MVVLCKIYCKLESFAMLNSGIYFYKAMSGSKVVQNKLVIIK